MKFYDRKEFNMDFQPFDNKMVLHGSYKDKEKLRAATCEAKAAIT